jgi:hypothetical protein
MAVHDLPAADRTPMIPAAARDSTAGGRIYDAHIAEVARAAGAGRGNHRQPPPFPRRAPARHARRDAWRIRRGAQNKADLTDEADVVAPSRMVPPAASGADFKKNVENWLSNLSKHLLPS